MKTNRWLRILIIAAAIIVIGVIAVFYAIYSWEPPPQNVLEEKVVDVQIDDIELTLENCRVEFLPSNNDTTRIVVIGNDDNFTLQTAVSGDRLVIELEDQFRLFPFNFNRSYSLQVYVPSTGLASLSADSENGRIQAEDITATELSLQADNGRISLKSVKSETVDAETDNGRIELTNMAADMTVRSSNGHIVFKDVSGVLQAKANNGRIQLTTDTLDFPIDFEADNGRIEIHADNEPENTRIKARADNGSINVFGRVSEEVIFGSGDVLIRLVSKNGRIVVE